MPNFFVPARNIQGTSFFFDETESRHLTRVLRKKEGDTLQIFDGEGSVYPAKLIDCSEPKKVRGEIITAMLNPERSELDRVQSRISLSIYPAVLKGPRFDWLLEKATELGVSSICPVRTERTLIKLEPSEAISKQNRWEKIILAAAKQCGRADLPAVDLLTSYSGAVGKVTNDAINVILWEREKKESLSDVLSEVPIKKSVKINLFTGPEGGFTLQEIDQARKRGVSTVLLGPLVLRAETAVIAAISRILL